MSGIGPVIVCGPSPIVPDTTSDCPDRDGHTPRPAAQGDFFAWATRMAAAGAHQQRCPGCKLLKVWTAPVREVKWP